MIAVVLFDLDGVIRHFDARDAAGIEERHGLRAGVLGEVAFSQPLLDDVTTGLITRAQWIHMIGDRIGNVVAASEWSRLRPSIDHEVLRLVDELRAEPVSAAVLTNGTDTIATELAESGVAEHFDAIFNSADIGYAKPDQKAFTHVLEALNCAAGEVFFTDDSPAKLSGASKLGMPTHLFAGVPGLRAALRAAGVPCNCS
ncbi:MAG: HAD-IA family hydrolase [Mycolicibacterium cosmeticum]|nr:HAD-IA family hydrolase [Mycolicibacterium cosmeticum]